MLSFRPSNHQHEALRMLVSRGKPANSVASHMPRRDAVTRQLGSTAVTRSAKLPVLSPLQRALTRSHRDHQTVARSPAVGAHWALELVGPLCGCFMPGKAVWKLGALCSVSAAHAVTIPGMLHVSSARHRVCAQAPETHYLCSCWQVPYHRSSSPPRITLSNSQRDMGPPTPGTRLPSGCLSMC